MLDNLVASLPMAAKKKDVTKEAISITLTAAHLAALRALSESIKFKPSVSQLIDDAVGEYLARQIDPPKRSKPK